MHSEKLVMNRCRISDSYIVKLNGIVGYSRAYTISSDKFIRESNAIAHTNRIAAIVSHKFLLCSILQRIKINLRCNSPHQLLTFEYMLAYYSPTNSIYLLNVLLEGCTKYPSSIENFNGCEITLKNFLSYCRTNRKITVLK